jgi:hypothetical protein
MAFRKSEDRSFVEALKHGLELKRQCPRSDVKLRDAHENTDHNENTVPNRTWGIGRAAPVNHRIDTTRTRFLAKRLMLSPKYVIHSVSVMG